MDAMQVFIEHAMQKSFEALPPQTAAIAKRAVLDTLACLVTGSSGDGVAPLLGKARDWGGKAEARVLVFGDKIPAHHAALLNGMMARCPDYDDMDVVTGEHPSVAAVPTTLTAADAQGGVTGEDFLVAIALAMDLAIRIRRATPLRMGHRMAWTTGTFAPLTGTFAAARALKLNRQHFSHAMGIAFATCSNTMQSHTEGALAHRVHQGLAAQSSLLAIALAKEGITGVQNPLEGKFGFYRAYLHGDYSRELLLAGLGERYLTDEISIKPFPCGGLTHGPAEAIMQLARQTPFSAADIKRITVRVNESAYAVCAKLPWVPPPDIVTAQFSIPYVVGAAAVRGRVSLDEFTEESIRDPAILAVAALVVPEHDPALDALSLQVAPTEVIVELHNGRRVQLRLEFVPGHPRNPLDFDAVSEKFVACSRHAARPIDMKTANAVIKAVSHLERMSDIRELVQLLC